MPKAICYLCVLTLTFPTLFCLGQAPDWSSTIASIIYENCTSCHREEGVAPMPLLTYDDAVQYAFSIQAQVNAKKMPPWPPDPNYNHFWGERVLSETEIQAINDWVNAGMPAGDLSQAPDPPVYEGKSLMTDADDTIVLPHFTIPPPPPNGFDTYHTFVIKSGYTETKYIQEVEFLPNTSVVHHIFVYHDTSDQSWIKDSLEAGPGFPGGGQGAFSDFAEYLFGWTPGSMMLKLPYGMGFAIPPGADWVVTIHYAPGTEGMIDSTIIKLKFAEGPTIRPVYSKRLMYWHKPYLLNGPFIIPANTVKAFFERSDTFWEEKSLLQIQPHSHLICVKWEIYMVDANNDTTNILLIPEWDFYWQMGYILTKLMKIPVGAVIYGRALFDNTVNNPNNPSNPPVTVTAGQSTYDEMMAVRASLLDYMPGDENYIIDSAFYGLPTVSQPIPQKEKLPLRTYPNPVASQLNFITDLPEPTLRWSLYHSAGKKVRQELLSKTRKGIFHGTIDVSDLPAGLYFLTVNCGNRQGSAKVIVSRDQ
ncbi:MAG: T9SS type A sorting domain-containing protein [Chitinophagales bacterium]|nr:T9SS type A sorting domain-containing protein [Chitinophagales bacterium]MDW8426932.1 T9SS type A sorting domain-containing protein [Chitinophagales bacterium]